MSNPFDSITVAKPPVQAIDDPFAALPTFDPFESIGQPSSTSPKEQQEAGQSAARQEATGVLGNLAGSATRGMHSNIRGLKTSAFMLGLDDDVDGLANTLASSKEIEARYPKSAARVEGEKAVAGINETGWGAIWPTVRETVSRPEFLVDLTAESISSAIPSIAGAAGGAVAGSAMGPVGAAAGAKLGLSAGSGVTDYGASFESFLAEKYQPQNASEWKNVLSNKEAVNEAHWYAAKHSGAVALFDLVGAHAGGKIASRYFVPNTGIGKKLAAGAGGAAVDMLAEGAGEATGTFLGKGQVDVKDAVLESLASGPTSIGSVLIDPLLGNKQAPVEPPSSETLENAVTDISSGKRGATTTAPAAQPEGEVIVAAAENVPMPRPKPIFYSTLKDTIVKRGPQAASPEQWMGTIRNQPGVKHEEIEETGLGDFISSAKGKLTKDEVLAHLEQNEVQVQEVLRQEGGETDPAMLAIYSAMGEKQTNTEYHDWQLPGPKSNYRELLLTLPTRDPPDQPVQNPRGWGDTDGGDVGVQRGGQQDYRGGHFSSTPNILAHVRFNDREDREGRPVLFIEEIQSDWHQVGRKMGYKGSKVNPAPEMSRMEAIDEKIYQLAEAEDPIAVQIMNSRDTRQGMELAVQHGIITREDADYYNRGADYERTQFGGVPDAPFKSSWPELTFKRMLRWAADNGYSRIAWTTGLQQAERYRQTGGAGGVLESNMRRQRGMVEFYDKMLPAIAKKYAKKYGGRVGQTGVFTEGTLPKGIENLRRWSESVHYLDVPPQAHSQIQEGLPLFAQSLNGAPMQVMISDKITDKDQLRVAGILQTIARKLKISRNITLKFGPLPHRGQAEFHTGTGEYVIIINPQEGHLDANGKVINEAIYATLMHEFGHIVMWDKFSTASDHIKQSIRAAYTKFLAETPFNPTMSQLVAARDNALATFYNTSGAHSGSHKTNKFRQYSPEQRKYWAGFEEWFAEQVARWGTSDITPLTVVEKFFKNMGVTIARIFREMQQKLGFSLRPDKVMQDWLNSFIESGPTLQPILQELDQRTRGDSNVPDQEEVRMPRDAVNKLFEGNPPPEVKKMMKEVDKFTRFYKWMLSLPQVAKRNPHIAELQLYREDVQAMHGEQQKIMDFALRILKRWRSIGPEGDRLAGFIEDVQNLNFRTPDEVRNDVVRHPTTAELSVLAKKHNIGDRGLRVYDDIRRSFLGFLDVMQHANETDAKKYITDPAALRDRIDAIRTQYTNMRRRPYFPHMRFGKHTITVRDAGGKVVHFETVERRGILSAVQVQKRIKRDLEAGIKKRGESHTVTMSVLPDNAQGFVGLPPQMLDMLENRLELDSGQRTALEELRYEMAPSSSFKHRFQKRSNVAGFSTDFKRAFANYFFSAAQYYGKAKYAPTLREHIKAIWSQSKYMPDGVKRGQIANFMADHFDELMDPTPDLFGGRLRSMMFLWALGFSPAAATLNLTQLMVGTAPFLASKFGDASALAAMTKAGVQMSTYYKRGTYEGMTDFHMRAIQMGIKTGVITEAMAPELAAMTDGNNLKSGLPGAPSQTWMWILEKSAGMFELAEQMNRRITFRAALELAQKKPDAKHVKEAVQQNLREYNRLIGEGWTPAEATAFVVAKDAVETTQYVYARWAQPRFMRGKLKTVFVFKTFLQNTLFMLWNNPGTAARSMLVTGFIGGLMGLPGGEDLKEIIRAIAYRLYGKDFNVELEARRMVLELANGKVPPDLVLHGLARRGFGIPAIMDGMGAAAGYPDTPFPVLDRSRAVGLGNILPFEVGKLFGPPQKDDSRVIADQIQRASGAAFGTFFNIYKALTSDLEMLDPKRWERAVPRALGSASKSYRAFTEGRERTQKGSTLVPYDVRDPEQFLEAASLALGYTPLRQSAQWDRIIAEREVKEFWDHRKRLILGQYDAALQAKDDKELDEVRGAIRKYNSDLPENYKGKSISADTVKRSLDAKARSRAAHETGTPITKSDIGLARDIQSLFPESVVNVRKVR